MEKTQVDELESAISLRIERTALALAQSVYAASWQREETDHAGALAYGQGQIIALSKVRRWLRGQQHMSGPELTSCLQREQARWQTLAPSAPHCDGTVAPDMTAYRQGAEDAIAALLRISEPALIASNGSPEKPCETLLCRDFR